MAERGNKPGTPADVPASGSVAPGAGATVAAAAAGPGPAEAGVNEAAVEEPSLSPEAASLLGLVDRLSSLLERSDLVELEVQAGETGIVLRKPAAIAPAAADQVVMIGADASDATPSAPSGVPLPATPVKVIRAPLTGIFYASSSPSAPPYVTVGQPVAVGQVIGLIEAMKLFNEIKSDASGRVARIVAESGKLVKAKQPLIEVEP